MRKRTYGSVLSAATLVLGCLALAEAQPSAASSSYLLQNVATGKCMQGDTLRTAQPVDMVTCNKNDAYQKWGLAHGKVVLVFSGTDVNICLGVPKYPSGDFAREVVSVDCSDTN